MAKFKVGEKVRVIGKSTGYSKFSKPFVGYVTHVGPYLGGGGDYSVDDRPYSGEASGNFYKEMDLEKYEMKFADLNVGDKFTSTYGTEYSVIASINEHVIIAMEKDGEEGIIFTDAEFKNNDYTIKTEGDDVKEVTLEEIAEQFGVDVSNIRVRD